MKLKCKNKECESNISDENPCFTVNMTVDEDGVACEPAKHIDGEYFTCCHCGGKAEWIN